MTTANRSGDNRFKRGFKTNRKLRRFKKFVFLGLGIWFLYIITVSEQGIVRIIAFKHRIDKAAETVEVLKARRDSLKRELNAIADDPAAIERKAREELGMVKPGEIIYKLVPAREGPDKDKPADRGAGPTRDSTRAKAVSR